MFWGKKVCGNCTNKIETLWAYCPFCGNGLKENAPKVEQREMKPKFIVHPKGVSITITSDNFSPPKIDVRSYGENKHHHHNVEEKPVREIKTTEEPKTKIQRVKNKQIITMDIPDVKGLEDIEITQLQQSIEIKAFAGEKAYFKLIPIPSHATVNNEFKDGVLKIEVEK